MNPFNKRKLIREERSRLGEIVDLPNNPGAIFWAELEVKRSWLGKIIHTIYKSPHILLESVTSSGQQHVFQIVPELGKAGFIVSPMVLNNRLFAQLYSDAGGGGGWVSLLNR